MRSVQEFAFEELDKIKQRYFEIVQEMKLSFTEESEMLAGSVAQLSLVAIERGKNEVEL